MRPRGEIREALAQAWCEAPAAMTWRDAFAATVHGEPALPIGEQVFKQTVRNMLAAGELVPAGTVRVPGVSRPMLLLSPAVEAEAGAARVPTVNAQQARELERLVHSWAQF